jgi:hypothetical protein
MSDIFISYERSDLPMAKMLAQRLGSQGWTTFWDRKIRAGSNWRKTIGKELDSARCVVVLWSKASLESDWVHNEADDARRRAILVPILIEDIQAPIGFRHIQAENLANWEGSESAEEFEGLISGITAVIGSPPKLARQEATPPAAERFVAKFLKNKPKRDKEDCYEISFGVLGYPSGTRQIVFFTDHPDSLEEGKSLQEALCTVVIVKPQQRRVFVNEDEAWDIDGDFRLYAVGVFGNGRTFTLSTMLCDALDAHYSAAFPEGVPERFARAISDLRVCPESLCRIA